MDPAETRRRSAVGSSPSLLPLFLCFFGSSLSSLLLPLLSLLLSGLPAGDMGSAVNLGAEVSPPTPFRGCVEALAVGVMRGT